MLPWHQSHANLRRTKHPNEARVVAARARIGTALSLGTSGVSKAGVNEARAILLGADTLRFAGRALAVKPLGSQCGAGGTMAFHT